MFTSPILSTSLRIVFFSNRDSYVEGDICHYDGANGRLIEALLARYPNMTVVTYIDPIYRPYYTLPLRPKRLIALPFRNSFNNGLKNMNRVAKLLRQLQREHDLLIIQLPFKSFLAPLLLKKPVVYHICSNLKTAAANPVKYRGWRRWIARSYAELFHYCHLLYLRRQQVRLISNGSELGKLYGRSQDRIVISTSIYKQEVLTPEQLSPKNEIFRILFVGRPSLEKGFDTLLEAIQLLQQKTPKFELICVGFTEEVFEQTWQGTSLDNIKTHIQFRGEIPFSSELFTCYQQADVLVLPSRSEGTPRVLVEARAFGCPVISTWVGGIPDSIIDGEDGFLFEPGDSFSLATHLERLASDEKLRHQIQIKGLQAVLERMTLERFSENFILAVQELMASVKKHKKIK